MLNRKLPLSLMLGVALLAAGCGNESQADKCASQLEIDLSITNDIQINVEGLELVINEVIYEISGNGLNPPIVGTIDTSDPNATASVEVFGLLPGEGYLVELEATSEDAKTTCRGSADFDVTVGAPPTEVHVLLRCSVGQRFGAVRADGWFNICAELIKGVVAPLETSIGDAIIVTSQAEDWEDDDVTYNWSAMNGSFEDPSAASTFYTCAQTGMDTLTLTVSDDDFEYCMDSWSVDIECVDENGTGGTGGSGTGGTAGSGTGGTGGSGNGSGTGGTGNGSGTGGTGNGSGTGGTGNGSGTGGTGNGSGTGGTGNGSGTAGTGGAGNGSGTAGTGGAGNGSGTAGTGSGSGTGGAGGDPCQVTLTVN